MSLLSGKNWIPSFAGITMRRIAIITLMALSIVACSTVKKEASVQSLPERTEFQPRAYVSRIHLAQGRYPGLFSDSSYALWVGPGIAALKREKALEKEGVIEPELDVLATQMTENYVVLECHMASMFADSSIAYDVVGFRGLDIYLIMPDGRRVYPVQRTISTHASEHQVDALKRFERANLLVFPTHEMVYNPRLVDMDSPTSDRLRLVIEGFNSTFYFEWVDIPLELDPEEPSGKARRVIAKMPIPSAREVTMALRIGFKEFYSLMKNASTKLR